jgi:hypothetical protein
MVKTRGGWICSQCERHHLTEEAARACAEEDALNSLDPPKHTRQLFFCEMCDEEHYTNERAEECEKKHTEAEDKHFMAWKAVQDQQRLEKAARAEGQKKLGDLK